MLLIKKKNMVKRKSLPVRHPRLSLASRPKRLTQTILDTKPKFRKPSFRTPTTPVVKSNNPPNPKIRKPDSVQPKEDTKNAYFQKSRSDLVNPMLANVTRLKMK